MASSSPMNDSRNSSGSIADRPTVSYGGGGTNTTNAAGETRIGGAARINTRGGQQPGPDGAAPAGGAAAPSPSPGPASPTAAAKPAAAPASSPTPAPAPMQPPQSAGGQMVPGRSAGSMVFQPNAPASGAPAGSQTAMQPPPSAGGQMVPGRSAGSSVFQPASTAPGAPAAPGGAAQSPRPGQMVPGRSAGSMVFQPSQPAAAAAPGAPAPAANPAQQQAPRPGQLVPGRSAGSMVWQPATPAAPPAPAAYPGSRGQSSPAGALGAPPASTAPKPAAASGSPQTMAPPAGPLTPQQMKDRAAQQAAAAKPGAPPPGAPAAKAKNFEGFPTLAAWKAAQVKQRAPLSANTAAPSGSIRVDPSAPKPMAPPAPGAKNIDGYPSLAAWKEGRAQEQAKLAASARQKLQDQIDAKNGRTAAAKPESRPGKLTPEDAEIFRKGNLEAVPMTPSEIALRRRAEGLPESSSAGGVQQAPAAPPPIAPPKGVLQDGSKLMASESPSIPRPGGKVTQMDATGKMVDIRHPQPGPLPPGARLTVIDGHTMQVSPTTLSKPSASKALNPQAPPSPIRPPKMAPAAKPKPGMGLRRPQTILA